MSLWVPTGGRQTQFKGREAERRPLPSPVPHPLALDLSKQEEIFQGRVLALGNFLNP